MTAFSRFTTCSIALILLTFISCKKSVSSSGAITGTISGTTVSTVAGTGKAGAANGLAAMATFNEPGGVCTDNDGNILVADYSNGIIRKIDVLKGLVSSLAGDVQNNQSCSDGVGTGAGFTFPLGVCSNVNGDIFVADESCGLRTISSGGVVGTLFKNDVSNPLACYPSFACADNQGNVFAISLGNASDQHVYSINKQGQLFIFAGSGASGYKDGAVLAAQFIYLKGIFIDNNNNVFVVDGSRVREITGGQVRTVARNTQGGYVDGPATIAQFGGLAGICGDNKGSLYVTDGGMIRKIDAQGNVTTVAGDGNTGYKDGEAATAEFHTPRGLCVDAQGNLLVADFSNNCVRKITFKQ